MKYRREYNHGNKYDANGCYNVIVVRYMDELGKILSDDCAEPEENEMSDFYETEQP